MRDTSPSASGAGAPPSALEAGQNRGHALDPRLPPALSARRGDPTYHAISAWPIEVSLDGRVLDRVISYDTTTGKVVRCLRGSKGWRHGDPTEETLVGTIGVRLTKKLEFLP